MSGVLKIFDSKIKTVKWKLLGSSFLSEKVSSPHFTFVDKVYYISVDRDYNYGLDCVADLHAVDKDMENNFDYVIGYERPDGSARTVNNTAFFFNVADYEPTYRSRKSMPKAGNITLICEIHHPDKTNCADGKSKEFSSQTDVLECVEQLSRDMKELLINSRHADITIKVGKKEFKAHKSVLAARSPVLDSMFSHEMSEKESGILNITDTDESAFEAFLMFLYTGKVDEIPICNVTGLYEIADKYDIKQLKIECIKRLMIEMSVDLVCDSLRLATLYEEKLLLETAINYFVENVKEVLDTETWESFCKDHFKLGNELLKRCFEARLK